MKTRIITAVVGLGVLAVVLGFFDTFLFDLVLSAICLIAIHEVFSAMGFGKKQWYLYAAAVPLPCWSCSAPRRWCAACCCPPHF